MLLHKVACWLSLGSLTLAGAIPRDAEALPPSRVIVERQATTSSPVPDGECTNGPNTRQCWSRGFSIATDFDAKAPPEGKTVTYDLEITNTTADPDGNGPRPAMLLNLKGKAPTYPGPTIRAAWGDTLVINVHNKLQDNGTGIHWHGIRQLNSCQQDGVGGITECPIAPNEIRQYRFKATQFGTTWYHSHWSAQYGDGVVGTMIIDGPAPSNYDEDLGVLPLTDWYYTPAFTLNEQAQHSLRGPPVPDTILVNGTHVNANGGGKYFKMNVKKGKKYRIRLINTSVDTVFHVSMDGHPFTVMTSDFVPIKTYVANQVSLNIGQRYDVVINANQTVGNYWFRVGLGTACQRNEIIAAGIPLGAILHYDGAPDANPTTTPLETMRTACADENRAQLTPYVPNTVPASIVGEAGKLNQSHFQDPAKENLFRWLIDGTPHIVDWNKPSLETVMAGSTDFGENSNVHVMSTDGWYLWWIQADARTFPLPHPIHLHGHDFYLIGSGTGQWDGSTTGLTLNNPTRRDTATMPGGGYLLLAFPADNPGMWVMHCHIAWHASQGLSMQFMERRNEIKASIGSTAEFEKGCRAWNQYWQPGNHPYNQTDSGL